MNLMVLPSQKGWSAAKSDDLEASKPTVKYGIKFEVRSFFALKCSLLA